MRDQAFDEIVTGEVQGGTTAAQLPDVPCSMVNIKAETENATNVYLGVEGVTIPNGETDETTGFVLDAGQETGWLHISNLNQLWMITDANGDDIVYMVLRTKGNYNS